MNIRYYWLHFKRIPRALFHMSPASACVVLIVTLVLLIPVLLDLLRGG